MEHKQKAMELEKGCGEKVEEHYGKCGDYKNWICKKCKEKRRKHKEEVLKGCEHNRSGIICINCQEVLKRYEEAGI